MTRRLGDFTGRRPVIDVRDVPVPAVPVRTDAAGDVTAGAGVGVGELGLAAVPAAGGPVLSLEQVRVEFSGVVALDDVTFDVTQGSRTGLIGPNGAGKTTLFNVLSGLTRPKSGRVRLGDHDVTFSAPARRASLGLGRTFQVPSLVQDLTVAENVLIGRHLRMAGSGGQRLAEILRLPGWWGEERRNDDLARQVAEFCGVAEHWGTVVGSLPFGVQRLVEIARAVCSEPVVLALDEPAAGLDEGETSQLGVLLRRIQDETGITILVIEHDMDMVMGFCDQLFVLDFGRLIASGTPAEIQRNQAVLEAYLGVAHA